MGVHPNLEMVFLLELLDVPYLDRHFFLSSTKLKEYHQIFHYISIYI